MDRAEYLKRFHENQRITGFGLQTTMHAPCPFCAAADFMVFKIQQTEKAMVDGAVCKECKRGLRAIMHRGAGGAVVSFEFVQTEGPAPDPGIGVPAIRVLVRVD